jgi:hypothetical protein
VNAPAVPFAPSRRKYDDGRCKIERKLEKSGEYKEEIKRRP